MFGSIWGPGWEWHITEIYQVSGYQFDAAAVFGQSGVKPTVDIVTRQSMRGELLLVTDIQGFVEL